MTNWETAGYAVALIIAFRLLFKHMMASAGKRSVQMQPTLPAAGIAG